MHHNKFTMFMFVHEGIDGLQELAQGDEEGLLLECRNGNTIESSKDDTDYKLCG